MEAEEAEEAEEVEVMQKTARNFTFKVVHALLLWRVELEMMGM